MQQIVNILVNYSMTPEVKVIGTWLLCYLIAIDYIISSVEVEASEQASFFNLRAKICYKEFNRNFLHFVSDRSGNIYTKPPECVDTIRCTS